MMECLNIGRRDIRLKNSSNFSLISLINNVIQFITYFGGRRHDPPFSPYAGCLAGQGDVTSLLILGMQGTITGSVPPSCGLHALSFTNAGEAWSGR
jgi:hypothetical protein